MSTGKIVQIQGPVVDIEFPSGQLPRILNAVTIVRPVVASKNGHGAAASAEAAKEGAVAAQDLTVEVAQHLGNDVVRCIAMSSTDGLVRGGAAVDTGSPIMVPVGQVT